MVRNFGVASWIVGIPLRFLVWCRRVFCFDRWGAAIDLEQLLEELLDEDAGRGGEEHHDGAAGNTEVIHEAGAGADPIAQYRLELALFKRKALAWMKRGQIAVLADLIEMRTILEPHRKYIQELLMMSGQDWELRQQAKAFDFSTGLSDHGRQYRLLVSAFVQHYGELLGNAESLADLRATALFVQEDQAAVECGFARVRRSLTFHSVQTHQEHFESTARRGGVVEIERGCDQGDASSKRRCATLRSVFSRDPEIPWSRGLLISSDL